MNKNDLKRVKLTAHLAKYIDVMIIYEAIISDKNYEYLEVVKKKVWTSPDLVDS